MPNWLREEIIKNKATITSSTPEPFKDESESNEDEMIGKSTSKVDQTDSKSVDSARSPEEEDDDEVSDISLVLSRLKFCASWQLILRCS